MISRWILFFIMGAMGALAAQPVPGVQWQRCLPGSEVMAVARGDDHTVLAAWQELGCPDAVTIGLSALDAAGNTLWQTSLVPAAQCSYRVFSLTQYASGWLVAGSMDSAEANYAVLWRLDGNGSLDWRLIDFFSDSLHLTWGKAVPAADGSIAWLSENFNAAFRNVVLSTVDTQGLWLWKKEYGGSHHDFAADVLALEDGFLLAATTYSKDGHALNKKDSSDVLLIRTDLMGNVQWSKCFGGTHFDFARSLVAAPTSFWVAASSRSVDGDVGMHIGSQDYYDVWLFRINGSGTKLWGATFGGDMHDYCTHMTRLHANGFLISANSYSASGSVTDGMGPLWQGNQWTFLIDSSGNFKWGKCTGGLLDDWTNAIVVLDSLRFVLGGATLSPELIATADCSASPCEVASTSWLTLLNSACPSFAKASFQYATEDLTVSFTNLSSNATDYWWDFGDGTSTAEGQPEHTFSMPGNYSVCLIATNDCSSDTVCSAITVCSKPIADFTYTITELGVTFSDNSLFAQTWQWNFGDGHTASVPNPFHSYASYGVYTVQLIVSNFCGLSDTLEKLINTCSVLEAGFTFEFAATSFLFMNQSAGNPSHWHWDFGDGMTAIGPTVQHTYTTGGMYTVCLAVEYPDCPSDTFCTTVNVCQPAVVDGFTAIANYQLVQFNSMTQHAEQWFWDFGDGTSSTDEHPVHQYATGGSFLVCLIAFNDCRSDTLCMEVNVACNPVTAHFEFAADELMVSFSNTSAGASSWWWDFGDGTFSSAFEPQHTYTLPGFYEVCLTAFSTCTSAVHCTVLEISCAKPAAAFMATTDLLTVYLENFSQNFSQVQWDLGDGNMSTVVNPTHTYMAPGNYQVCLIASNVCGSDTLCQWVEVQCPAFELAFTYTQHNDTVYFVGISGQAISWLWHFGDGTFDTISAPIHVYEPGIYVVCLTAFDGCSWATYCDSLFVYLFDPPAVRASCLLFPNPTESLAWLYCPPGTFVPGMIRFSDMYGRIMPLPNIKQMADGLLSVDVSLLPSGCYQLHLITDQGMIVLPIIRH